MFFSICIIAQDIEPIKARVIVTTDGEIDDKSSFIRFLMYCNEFNTEGLIYGNSKWQRHGHGTQWMQETIDLWSEVRLNLIKHLPDYPTVEELKSVIKIGNMQEKYLNFCGPLDTEGSEHIINILLDNDPQPVWVQAWGGTNTIAQALWRLKESYTKEEYDYAISKLRIFSIADQDSTFYWIRDELPEVFLLMDHQFTALNYEHEGHPYTDHYIFSEEWMNENVKTNHSDFGAHYPQNYFSEGDSPAFFHLIMNGLRSTEHPSYGGWGGRWVKELKSNYWHDAKDDGDRLKPQWRWLLDIQNDFAARMDYAVTDKFENANHAPIVVINHDLNITSIQGSLVTLNASESYDPDDDSLSYKWWHYYDVTSPSDTLIFQDADKSILHFYTPKIANEEKYHIILEVSDNGNPMLKSYQRIILTTKPN